jgi:hypothetical protein
MLIRCTANPSKGLFRLHPLSLLAEKLVNHGLGLLARGAPTWGPWGSHTIINSTDPWTVHVSAGGRIMDPQNVAHAARISERQVNSGPVAG